MRPAKVAVETLDGRSVTFAQLNSRVNSLVASVSAVGISRGARVAILARNTPEYLEVFGLAKAGIVVVPLNWRLTSAEIAKLLAHCEAELVFVDDAHFEVASGLREGAPSVRHWVSIGAATAWAMVSASAPGYAAETVTTGGAISGYCAIGSLIIAPTPAITITADKTTAKIGRWMQNREIITASYFASG